MSQIGNSSPILPFMTNRTHLNHNDASVIHDDSQIQLSTLGTMHGTEYHSSVSAYSQPVTTPNHIFSPRQQVVNSRASATICQASLMVLLPSRTSKTKVGLCSHVILSCTIHILAQLPSFSCSSYPSPCTINKTNCKHCCPCDSFVPFPLLILPSPQPSLPPLPSFHSLPSLA